ncbi:hypothetical protein GE09DRAFT_1145972 [Coniochaeta sp. 2T2.1]|nr:hypothetical protein GE09DRAFT_1145972 [Coniochaeta sp. 2T2.1]
MHEIPKQPATPAQSLQLQGISERAGERNSPVTPMTLPLVPRISLSSPNQPSSPAIVWHVLGHPQSLLDQSLRQVTGRVQPRQFRLNLLLRGQPLSQLPQLGHRTHSKVRQNSQPHRPNKPIRPLGNLGARVEGYAQPMSDMRSTRAQQCSRHRHAHQNTTDEFITRGAEQVS